MCVGLYVIAFVCMSTCVCAFACVCTCVYMLMCACAEVETSAHVCVFVCVFVYVFTIIITTNCGCTFVLNCLNYYNEVIIFDQIAFNVK